MANCFLESGLPLAFFYGTNGLYSANSRGSIIKRPITNLYPYPEAKGIIAFHITEELMHNKTLPIKADCASIGGYTSMVLVSSGGSGGGTSVNYGYRDLPNFLIKNDSQKFEHGKLYYFGDLEYKRGNKSYQVHDNRESTYNDLLKILPDIRKLPQGIKLVSIKQ
jgi:hypothetical protein